MSAEASGAARVFCILLPLCFFFVVRSFGCWAAEDWLRASPFLTAWRLEIATLVVFAWTLFVSFRICLRWRVPLDEAYGDAFRWTAIEHVFILGLAMLLLDGGLTFGACLVAAMLYWMAAGLVIARRPSDPSMFDTGLVSAGYAVLAFLASWLAWAVNAGYVAASRAA
jgi:hypothetical protein